MSYNIFYKAIAVQHPTEPKFLILSERGDNNVWEANGRRRARSWGGDSMVGCGQGQFRTAAEIETDLRTVDFDSGCYAVYGGRRDFEAHWSLYKRALKNPITFETASRFGLSFSLWSGHTNNRVNVPADFDAFCAERDRLFSDGWQGNFWLVAYIDDWDYKKLFPRKPRQNRQPRKGTHVVYMVGYGYLYKRSSRRVWCCYGIDNAKQYSEREATKLAETLNGRGYSSTFVVKPIEQK